MRVDILPALSVASGLDIQQTVEAWDKARVSALKANKGVDDTRTYTLTLENFRQAHPFDYATLGQAAQTMSTPRANDVVDRSGTAQPL